MINLNKDYQKNPILLPRISKSYIENPEEQKIIKQDTENQSISSLKRKVGLYQQEEPSKTKSFLLKSNVGSNKIGKANEKLPVLTPAKLEFEFKNTNYLQRSIHVLSHSNFPTCESISKLRAANENNYQLDTGSQQRESKNKSKKFSITSLKNINTGLDQSFERVLNTEPNEPESQLEIIKNNIRSNYKNYYTHRKSDQLQQYQFSTSRKMQNIKPINFRFSSYQSVPTFSFDSYKSPASYKTQNIQQQTQQTMNMLSNTDQENLLNNQNQRIRDNDRNFRKSEPATIIQDQQKSVMTEIFQPKRDTAYVENIRRISKNLIQAHKQQVTEQSELEILLENTKKQIQRVKEINRQQLRQTHKAVLEQFEKNQKNLNGLSLYQLQQYNQYIQRILTYLSQEQ